MYVRIYMQIFVYVCVYIRKRVWGADDNHKSGEG